VFAVRPVPYDGIIKHYGVQVGDRANVTVRIRANPKPRMQWATDKYVVEEGSADADYGVFVVPTELNRVGVTSHPFHPFCSELPDFAIFYVLNATNWRTVRDNLVYKVCFGLRSS